MKNSYRKPIDEVLPMEYGPLVTIEALRKAKGWSLTKLAAEVGVVERSAWNWEHGSVPGPEHRERIAAALGVRPEHICWHVPAEGKAGE